MVCVGGPLAGSSFSVADIHDRLHIPQRALLQYDYDNSAGMGTTTYEVYNVVRLYDHVFILLHEETALDDALRAFIKAYENVQTNKSDSR